jgi:hypothetical protein
MTHDMEVTLNTCALALKRYYATTVHEEKADYLSAYTSCAYKLVDALDVSFLYVAEMAHNLIGKTLQM